MGVARRRGANLLLAGLTVLLGAAALPAATSFEQEVRDAIDAGLVWLRDTGIYLDADVAPQARGLALSALLGRASAAPQVIDRGYDATTAADQALARSAAQLILNDPTHGVARGGCEAAEGFDAYGDGQNLSALSLYATTGGPDAENTCRLTLRAAIDRLVTRTLANQSTNGDTEGFWGPTGPGGVSWTTLFAAAGLAAAQEYYTAVDTPPGADAAAARQASAIAEALKRAAGRYAIVQNADGGQGDHVTSSASSYQQTASALWVALLGGGRLNESSVQGYLKWHYQNYNYDTIVGAFGDLSQSYYFYLWTSAVAYAMLDARGLSPDVGNVTTRDLGSLPAGAVRLDRIAERRGARNPARDFAARVTVDGHEQEPGRYGRSRMSWCYDYGYTLMTQQLPTGQFRSPQLTADATVSASAETWDPVADQAFAILTLEQVTGC